MVLIKSKRGVIFTLLAIVIISLFLVSFIFFSGYKERKTIEKRVETLNSYVLSLEKDMQRKVYIAGYRAIFVLGNEIPETGQYVTNFDNKFHNLFFLGTLDGEVKDVMSGATFPDIEQSVREHAATINANVTFNNPQVMVNQSDPWNIEVTLTAEYLLKDNNDLARWNKTLVVSAFIPITNFKDPLYFVSTVGVVTKNITKTPYEVFVSGNDVSNLSDHAINSYYAANPDAPSFLDRIQGFNSPDPNGIESFVNLEDTGIIEPPKSIVDHIFFSGVNPPNCRINGMPDWFRIDSGHYGLYGIDNSMTFDCI